MDNFCEWINDVDGINWYTDCGHTYFPYIRGFDQPKRIEDGEYDICPWCGKKIEYNEENCNEDEY